MFYQDPVRRNTNEWLHLTIVNRWRAVNFSLKGLVSLPIGTSSIGNLKLSSIAVNSYLWNIIAVNSCRSALARDSPTQTRGPIENGMKMYDLYWNFPLESNHLSGLNWSGSGKFAGSWWTPCVYAMTFIPFGIVYGPDKCKEWT